MENSPIKNLSDYFLFKRIYLISKAILYKKTIKSVNTINGLWPIIMSYY